MHNQMTIINALICKIQQLCFDIAAENIADTYCHFYGNVLQLEVYAYPKGQRPSNKNSKRLIDHFLYVDGLSNDHETELQTIINNLTNLRHQELAA